MHHWYTIINPNAGTGKAQRDWPQISHLLETAQIQFNPVFTQHPHHATSLTVEHIENGGQKILIVGGDGTLNEVINGLFIQDRFRTDEILLGVISVGTGNDWGRTLGIPANYAKAVDVIKHGQSFYQDSGMITYHEKGVPKFNYFINVAGTGFDSFVAQRTNQLKHQGKGGKLAYIGALLRCLAQFKSHPATLRIDDQIINTPLFSLSIGIGQYNGGGMKQLPQAKPDDGLFDITLIRDISKWEVISCLPKLFNGSFIHHPKISTYQAKRIHIESETPLFLETDGEIIGFTPLTLEIIPRSIQVQIPLSKENHL